jgi:hypothetical protein
VTRGITVEIPRDGYGRPMVLGDDGRRHAYQRVTTFVGVLENTWNIQQWEARKIVEGMGRRPDLVLASAATDPEDKPGLQRIASAAKEHALGSAAATTGTALHALTERVDRGQPLGQVPDSAEADIKAYEAATRGIENLEIEAFRVYDDWKIAGTADRKIRYRRGKYIADVKTGSIEYGQGKIAMQLACYARSTPYDIETDTRGEVDPELDLTKGLIIHLPAGQARCNLVWVDIERGWAACELAKQAWAWRKARNLTWPWDQDADEGLAALPIMGVASCRTLGELRDMWKLAAETDSLTPQLKALLERRSRELKGVA